MNEVWDRREGVVRQAVGFNLRLMGFDTGDVMLRLPLQAVWTALEEVDHCVAEMIERKEECRMTKRMLTVPCFPCVVCPDDGGYLSWKRRENQPQEEAWLECPECHRTWSSDEIGCSILDQFEAVDAVIDEIQFLSDAALSHLQEQESEFCSDQK